MHPIWLLVDLLLPMMFGAILPAVRVRSVKAVRIYVSVVTMVTSILTWVLILGASGEEIALIPFTNEFVFKLRFDAMGRFFAGIVATLWPMTVSYAYEYLKEDERQNVFFAYFCLAYGVTLGVTMSGNLFTLYCFIELLTLTTVPLVMHTRTRAAIRAARGYFAISLGGAAFALISMIYLTMGQNRAYSDDITRIFYVLGAFGFGVKAAIFPLHGWLPKASVAPTPVTALLHAVAVVKSGVFAIIRLTYFAYGTEMLKGTWAQTLMMCFALFTVVYGASKAVKESHWKRRLAYSTVANLSYILVGVFMMSEAGMAGGLMHMAFHAEIKILAFFAAGAVLHMTEREYIYDMDGLGRKMPWTFGCFLIAALGLMGIPPLSGFVSKWTILTAAAKEALVNGSLLGYAGAGAILVAAFLTAVYCLSVLRRAYFPDKAMNLSTGLPKAQDPSLWMLVPMVILAVGILMTGLFSGSILQHVQDITENIVMWR